MRFFTYSLNTFFPGGSLVSASWDKTLRIWNVVESSHAEPIELNDEALDVAYSPSGAVIAVCWISVVRYLISWMLSKLLS